MGEPIAPIECDSPLAKACDDVSESFARRIMVMFIVTSILVFTLEFLETLEILSNQFQGSLSFIVSVIAATIAVVDIHMNEPSASLRRGTYLLLFALVSYMFLSWTEDVPQLEHVVLLGGGDKSYRKLVKVLLLVCWFTSPPFLAWRLKRVHLTMVDALEETVADRTRRLTDANLRLQREIRQHVETGNELKSTQVKLENLVDKRSQQLAAAEQELVRHERLRALGKMASGIAHELNNTLVPVTSYVDLLLRSGDTTAQQREWLQHVAHAASDAAHVVSSLQRFNGKGMSPDARTLIDPAEIIQQVVDLTRPIWKDAAEAKGKRIRVELQIEEVAAIHANPAEIRQVLTNLLLNSVDAIDNDGTIQLSLKQHQEKEEVEFRVSDDGCGMTEDQLRSCIDPFFTTKQNGVGLGLSVCCGIVRNHGGRLDVESSSGGGTSFTFRLPVERRDCLQPSAPFEEEQVPALTALYAEDNERVRTSFTDLLRSLGVDVIAVESGAAAVEVALTTKFDLLIVDMGMPEMNGAEAVAAIRCQGNNPVTVVISGWPAPEVRQQFGEQRPPDFLVTKPIRADKIHAMLAEVRCQKSAQSVSGDDEYVV